jgi:hypothetical protein
MRKIIEDVFGVNERRWGMALLSDLLRLMSSNMRKGVLLRLSAKVYRYLQMC